MEKREQLLLAAKIFQLKDYFEFTSDNSKNLTMVDIEIMEEMSDEFNHVDEDRANKLVFNHDQVYLCNPLQYVILPDLLFNYMSVKEVSNGSDKTFELELNNTTPSKLMEAFQIAFNRINYEETHSQKSPKEYEEKLIGEMKAFDLK